MITYQTLDHHEQRLAQARARALWEVGDPDHADAIIQAYCNPTMDKDVLEAEKRDEDDLASHSARDYGRSL